MEAVGRAAPSRGKAEVVGSSAAAVEGVHNAASQEEASGRREDMAHKVEACRGIVEEEIVAGSSWVGRAACSHCTLALEGIAESGYKASSYLVAYSAALPADDDRSSCRLGMLPNRSRSASDWERVDSSP